jgi:Ca2+-binding RTX toxin-like protein
MAKAGRDTIWGFEDGYDLIDINGIDGNVATGSDNPFTFIGVNKAFSAATPGELRVVSTASGWMIEGSNDADTAAEFAIAVVDPLHEIAWDAFDFHGVNYVIEVGTTATFSGVQLTGSNIAINESADTGNTHLVIDVASGATNTFAALTFAAFGSSNAFDDGADTVTINGAAGNENITGTSIADIIVGGEGADVLAGGTGNDTYKYASSEEAAAGENIVEATGGGSADTIRTTATADLSALTVNGSADLEGAGSDQGIEQILIQAGSTATFIGGQLTGNSIIINESADGTTHLDINVASGATNSFANLTFSTFSGGNKFENGGDTVTIDGDAGQENITGTDIADTINGGDNNDTLAGGDGDDTINGDGDDDTIDGGEGEDILTGGAGNDTLTGGDDDDTFVFAVGDDEDTILDFDAGAGINDVIDVSAFGTDFDTLAEIQAVAEDDGTDTTIDFGNGDVLVLLDVLEADLNANDFLFV